MHILLVQKNRYSKNLKCYIHILNWFVKAAGSAHTPPGTPPATVIPLDTRLALTFRRTFMLAPLPTEIQSIHGQKYFGALLADGHHYRLESQSNVRWHSPLSDINPIQLLAAPLPTESQSIHEQKKANRYTNRNILAHFSNRNKKAYKAPVWFRRSSPTETYERFAPSVRILLYYRFRKPIE